MTINKLSAKAREVNMTTVAYDEKTIVTMPSKRKKLYVEFFFTGEDRPFVCGADGNVSCLDEIEENFLEEFDLSDDGTFKKAGYYLFKANYEQPQYGEFGMIELSGYWDLDLVAFEEVIMF